MSQLQSLSSINPFGGMDHFNPFGVIEKPSIKDAIGRGSVGAISLSLNKIGDSSHDFNEAVKSFLNGDFTIKKLKEVTQNFNNQLLESTFNLSNSHLAPECLVDVIEANRKRTTAMLSSLSENMSNAKELSITSPEIKHVMNEISNKADKFIQTFEAVKYAAEDQLLPKPTLQ